MKNKRVINFHHFLLKDLTSSPLRTRRKQTKMLRRLLQMNFTVRPESSPDKEQKCKTAQFANIWS